MKKTSSQNDHVVLAVICTLFAILRLPTLGRYFIGDEQAWLKASMHIMQQLPEKFMLPHPPLSTLTYFSSVSTFGISEASMRIVPFVLSVLTLWYVYKTAKEFYSPRVGIIASVLLTLNALHAMVSTQVDIDGTFLALFGVMTFYYYNKYKQDGSGVAPLVCALSLALISKFQGVLILGYVLLSIAWGFVFRKEKLDWKLILTITIIPALVFLLAIVMGSYFNYDWFAHSMSHLSKKTGEATPIVILLIVLAKVIALLSPIALVWLFGLNSKKKDPYFREGLLFMAAVALPNLKFLAGAAERYFAPLVPIAILLAAPIIAKKIPKKDTVRAIQYGAYFMALFFIVEYVTHGYVVMSPASEQLIPALTSIDWGVKIPITGSSGPLGFYFTFINLVVAFGLFGIAWCAHLLKSPAAQSCFLIAIAAACAFNIVLIEESTFSQLNVNVPSAFENTIDYLLSEPHQEPLVMYFKYDKYYLQQNYDDIYRVSSRQHDFDISQLDGTTFTLAKIDFTPSSDSHPVNELIRTSQCESKKVWIDDMVRISEVFTCVRT